MMKYFYLLTFLVACRNTSTELASQDNDAVVNQSEDSHHNFEEEAGFEDEQDFENANEEGSNNMGVQHILPLGDSITEGVPFTYRYPLYNLLTQQDYAFDFVGSHSNGAGDYPDSGWDQDNEGWAGWTTESIQEELSGWISEYKVDIALIHLGTNDAGGDDVEASAAAMTSIIEQLRTNNASVSICIAQILPFGPLPPEDGAPSTAELNAFVDNWNSRLVQLTSDMTTSQSPLVLVDMNSSFDDTDLDDGVHPTQTGAEKMAERWLACILNL